MAGSSAAVVPLADSSEAHGTYSRSAAGTCVCSAAGAVHAPAGICVLTAPACPSLAARCNLLAAQIRVLFLVQYQSEETETHGRKAQHTNSKTGHTVSNEHMTQGVDDDIGMCCSNNNEKGIPFVGYF